MIPYPNIDPVILQLGPLSITWYGLMYVLGFLIGWGLVQVHVNRCSLNWSSNQISDLIFYCIIGVVVGGRVGYVLFYEWQHFISEPIIILQIWTPGRSFHGGLLGVTLAMFVYSKRHKRAYYEIGDLIAPVVPIGLGFGRIGNFINGELYGRATDVPWAMVFPSSNVPVHPSQLYEFLLEGVVLFTILWVYSSKKRAPYAVSGMFLMCYGLFRFIVEFFRQPDVFLGYIAFDWMTMGQILSLPMIILGGLLIVKSTLNKTQTFN